jgi:cytochrome c553
MKDIRDGKRTNGLSIAMKAVVATVTDEEFQAIADWLAAN